MADTQAKIVLAAEDRTARVFAGLKSNLGAVRSQVDATNQSFIGLSPAILGAFSVVGISAFFGKVVDGIDKLNDLADATGSSVENLSGLEDIGARTGTSIDTVGAAVLKLNKNLLEAQNPTSEAAALFKQLGLNVGELSRLDPSDALLRVATALGGFAEDAKRGQFQMALLGKSTRELAPFLKDLAEAGKINATVTTEQAAEAEKFNQQLFQMQKNATDAGRAFVSELLPTILTMTTSSQDAAGGFDLLGAAIGGVKNVLQVLGVLGANVIYVLTTTGREIGAIAAQSAALARLDFAGFSAISDAVKADAVKARKELDDLEKRILGLGVGGDPSNYSNEGRGKPKPSLPTPGKTGGGGGKTGAAAAKDRLTDAQRYLENLQRQLQGTQDLTVAETVLADIQAGRLKLAKGESAQPMLDIAAQIDASKRQTEQLRAEAEQVRELRAEQEKLKSAGEAVFESTRTPREKLDADLAGIRDLYEKNAISADTYGRKVIQLNDEFEKLGEAKAVVQELDSFTARAAQNIQDTLGEELSNVLDGNFKNIGASFTKMLNRMVAEAAAAQLMNALFGDLKSGSGGGGLLGGLVNAGLSYFTGGSTYNGNKGGINGGSTILPNSLRGGAATGSNLLERDMITLLHKGEAVVPKEFNPAAGGRGAGVTIVQNFNVSGQTDARSRSQIATAAALGLQRELARNG
jgi:hypothetical protein